MQASVGFLSDFATSLSHSLLHVCYIVIPFCRRCSPFSSLSCETRETATMMRPVNQISRTTVFPCMEVPALCSLLTRLPSAWISHFALRLC